MKSPQDNYPPEFYLPDNYPLMIPPRQLPPVNYPHELPVYINNRNTKKWRKVMICDNKTNWLEKIIRITDILI